MLSYASIESAIMLAKLMRKSNVRIDGVLNGTLLSLLTNESRSLMEQGVDFDLEDIENGDYSKLITQIKEAHENGSVVEADSDEHNEYAPDMHTVWLSNYTDAISKAVENNISIVKDVIIPDVKTVYDGLIEIYNRSIVQPTNELFVIEDVPLPSFISSSCFSELVEEHDNHEAKEPKAIEFSVLDDKLKEKYLDLGGKKLGCIEDLETVNGQEKLDLINRYLPKIVKGDSINYLTPMELLVLTSFFAGIVEDPYFNSGASATENKVWADCYLHKVMDILINSSKMVTRQLREGKIFSYLNKDLKSLYPRPNVNGELRTVKTYLTNVQDLQIQAPLDIIIAGLIVDNVNLATVTQETLKSSADKAVSTWNRFTTTLANSNVTKTNSVFAKEAVAFIDKFKSECVITTNDFSLGDMYAITEDPVAYLSNMPLDEEHIYKLAKNSVLSNYNNTNIETIFNVLETAADKNKDMHVIGCGIVNKIVFDFVIEQIAWSRG